jgi:hypothetical protein
MKTQKMFILLFWCTTIALFGQTAVTGQTNDQSSEEITVDTNLLKTYIGRYAYDDGMINMVTLEAGQMYIQYTGQPKVPIFASSQNEFYLKVVEARMKFIADENGKVTHLIHRQNGMQFEPRRLADETTLHVDPVIYDKYVGQYMGDNNQSIVIFKDGDKLFGKTQGLPICQLHPVSETEYFPKELNARVRFVVTDDGTVNSISLNFNGYESTARRIRE